MSDRSARTIPELLSDTRAQVSSILSDTSALAKAEMSQSAKNGGIGAGLVVLALGLAWFALVALTIAFGFGLVALGLPVWAAFLIVTGVFILVAAGLVFIAIRFFKKVKAPERTIAAIKLTMSSLGGNPPSPSPATDGLD